jgi:hypothetical protein
LRARYLAGCMIQTLHTGSCMWEKCRSYCKSMQPCLLLQCDTTDHLTVLLSLSRWQTCLPLHKEAGQCAEMWWLQEETTGGENIQLFQLSLSMSKAEKSNTSAKGCCESLWKFINLLTIPAAFLAHIRLFRFARGQP